MYKCRVCPALYLTQREADLCTPAADIEKVYGPQATITAQTSAFNKA